MIRLLVLIVSSAWAVGTAAAQTANLPAFPEAEGFGMFTQGGRGGEVYFVTNLLDYASGERPIEGSLRAAVAAEGPRTVLFRVSGNIELKRILEIKHPYVTIAGQSAPGDGITLKNFGVSIEASDVVIRYLRVRPGDVAGEELDAINIRSSNVVVDHCSASWATDETVSIIGDATNVTVQWCLIAESLNASVHSKGEHGYGSLISTSGNVSVHHNIYALHKSRNPRPRDALLDFRNNLVYGWGDRAGYNEDDLTRMNYVGNVLLPLEFSGNDGYAFIVGGEDARIYLDDNLLKRPDGRVRTGWKLIRPPSGLPDTAAEGVLGVEQPFAAPSVATDDPETALERLLADAGATRPRRDAADLRVIDLIRNRGGAIIDSQNEVGGWPSLDDGVPPPDGDRDGMDDRWEERFGLDSKDPSDHKHDLDGDGYTNLEEYLNDTDPTADFGWLRPPVLRPSSGFAFTAAPLFVTMAPSEEDARVHYTMDGREPTRSAPIYDRPVRVYDDAHLRAKSISGDRPTTSAFAVYERISWTPAWADRPDDAVPGLRYAVYEADDWDEGVELEALNPVRVGMASGVDFGIRSGEGNDAVVFEGWLSVPSDGVYSFYLRDDVRSRLDIGGRTVTQGRPPRAEPGRVALRQGLHPFRLKSLHEEPRTAALEWSGPDVERGPIPDNSFVHTPH